MTRADGGRRTRAAAASIALLALASCSGGGNAGVAPAGTTAAQPAPLAPTPAPTASSGGTQSSTSTTSGTLSFVVVVPPASSSPASRAVKYVSPATQSIAIALKGQSTPLTIANVSPSSPGCSATSAGTSCTITASVPAGSETFVITAYAGTNGSGNQLSTADVPATITASSTTRIALTLNGTVATTAVILGSSSVPAGTPASVSVTIVAYDASNNIIVGPGTFSTPVTLTDTDPSGATSLSTTTVTAPGTSVTLNYTGNSMTGATITPSIAGVAGTPATFAATGTAFTNYFLPQTTQNEVTAMAVGPSGTTPNGALWFASSNDSVSSVGYITPQGVATSLTATFPGTYMMGLTQGASSTMYFGDDEYDIGTITASGSAGTVTLATNFTPCPGTCGYTNAMVEGPDGNVWFADDAGYIGRVTPSLTVTEWQLNTLPGAPSCAEPKQMAFYQGNIYVTDECQNSVDEIVLSGSTPTAVNYVNFQYSCGCGYGGFGLAVDAQGNVWFGDGCSNLGLVPAANFTAAGMLEWSVGVYNGNRSFDYLQATPAGIWAVDNGDGNVYNISSAAGVSASQGPVVTPVTAFTNSSADANVLSIGPDGNLWTVSDDGGVPAIAKIVYGAINGVQPASVHRASATLSHSKTGRYFPALRMHRPARRAMYAKRHPAQ